MIKSIKLVSILLPLLSYFCLFSQVAQASALAIYTAGDIADCRKVAADQSPTKRTAELIAKHFRQDPQARVLTLGDNTYPNGAAQEFEECYSPTWGQFKDPFWGAAIGVARSELRLGIFTRG
jgi:hypothetical protein